MKAKYVLLLILLLTYSCSKSENTPEQNGYDYVGAWELTQLEMSIAQDMNNDGVFSTNLVDELSCFHASMNFKSDHTYDGSGSALNLISSTETTIIYECNGETTDSGTWSEVEGGVKIGSIIFSRVGNQISLDIGDPIPGFLKVVYTKN